MASITPRSRLTDLAVWLAWWLSWVPWVILIYQRLHEWISRCYGHHPPCPQAALVPAEESDILHDWACLVDLQTIWTVSGKRTLLIGYFPDKDGQHCRKYALCHFATVTWMAWPDLVRQLREKEVAVVLYTLRNGDRSTDQSVCLAVKNYLIQHRFARPESLMVLPTLEAIKEVIGRQ